MDTQTIRTPFAVDDAKAPPALTTLARAMFEAYNDQAGGKTLDGRPTPGWNDLGPAVRANWRAAAVEASYLVTSACKRTVGTAVAGELTYPVLPEAA